MHCGTMHGMLQVRQRPSKRPWCQRDVQSAGSRLVETQQHGYQNGEPEVEVGVRVTDNALVALGAYDFLDLVVNEVVEGVNVLPHQAAHFEKCRQQLELVLRR